MSASQALRVVDHAVTGVLEIEWTDGERSRLGHAVLRGGCRCAACVQQRRAGQAPEVDAAVRLTAIHAIGNQGLNLVFDDGHHRGIYPWAYLRELAPVS